MYSKLNCSCFISLFLISNLIVTQLSAKDSVPVPTGRLATVEYCTGFDYDDYITILGTNKKWKAHPYAWKSLRNPGLNLQIGNTSNPLNAFINEGDSVEFNDGEANGVFTDNNGTIVDPAGYWVESYVPQEEGETAAILAAMVIWFWSSPVYVNYEYSDQIVGGTVAAIDCITLSAPSGPPHDVCDWNPDTDYLEQIEACNGLVVESVKLTALNISYTFVNGIPIPHWTYFDVPPYSGAEFVEKYDFYAAGPVLYDPPVSINSFSLINASERLATQVLLRTNDGSLIKARPEN